MLEWIMDADQEEPTFLVRRDREGQLFGWQKADVSGVIEVLSDIAYESAIGEDSDVVTVYVLAHVGAQPVKVTQKTHAPIGMVEVTLSWRDINHPGANPSYRGEVKVTGYRKILEV